MEDKFCVTVYHSNNGNSGYTPTYFNRFLQHCNRIAKENDWNPDTVVNYQLKPMGGRLIKTKCQGWYLRWDAEASHTAFVLRWS
jgi:hypothetical protein